MPGTYHDHESHADTGRIGTAFIIIFSFMLIEIAGGFLTGSLALLSDAGHMLSDAASLGLSYLAFKLGRRKATLQKTFGYRRSEILAALLNGVALLIIACFIFYEAYQRFLEPVHVKSAGMLVVSILGLAVNIVVALILMKGDTKENLNMRGAFLHVIGDTLGSLGAIIAAVLMLTLNLYIADPIASIVVAILILVGAVRLVRDALHILMEGSPDSVDGNALKQRMLSIPHVKGIHDLHIWSITSDFPSVSFHLVVDSREMQAVVLKAATRIVDEEFHLHHSTVQIDLEESDCASHESHCN